MNKRIQTLETQLRKLEQQIKEVQKRLPAHSVKPPMMMELIALEDEHAELLNELTQLKQTAKK
jgi:DNA repair exonuclease SbcCD ATPase subunit